jgi:hypothetical protein
LPDPKAITRIEVRALISVIRFATTTSIQAAKVLADSNAFVWVQSVWACYRVFPIARSRQFSGPYTNLR